MDSYKDSNVNVIEKVNKNKNNQKLEKEKENKENLKDKIKYEKENKDIKNKNIRIYSYNSRGFDMIKQRFCLELMEVEEPVVPVICNQENFVLKGNSHLIRKALKNFHVYIKPAKKDKLEGRPINGMFIALPKIMRQKSKDVSPTNDRIQAVLLETKDGYLMIINVYFPPDPKTTKYNSDSELEDLLLTIENLVASHHCRHVVMVGDMNTDYERKNGRVERFNSFLTDNKLSYAWKTFDVDFTHEFEKDSITYTSTIDHITWNDELGDKVKTAGVLHLVGNTSDHHPIYCDIQLSCKESSVSMQARKGEKKTKRVSTQILEEEDWVKFQKELDKKLSKLRVPYCIMCRDVHCKDTRHLEEVDTYTRNVLDAVDSAITSIASTKRQNNSSVKIVPGWSELVKPFCDDAKFWNAIWISSGKPINTELHRIMKRSRNVYHYAIRKCKRAEEAIKKDRLLKNCATSGRDIFSELRRLIHLPADPPSMIDGNEKPEERFSDVYRKLYNSLDDSNDTKKILDEVEECIDDESLNEIDQVTPEIIADVIKEIKANKNDPVFTFNSNCIKHAPASLNHHLANMIKCYLTHGHVSNFLLLATIIPLIKDKLGDAESSDNYRSIALSSVILKIFDWIVLTLFGKTLGLDELQLSYQKNCSTTMCTWLVVESIGHFTRNGSEVYACFMDMKKAFDLVKHSLLFRKLVERKMPPIFIRLLIYMYVHQAAKVKWNGSLSDAFSILNGVKQGAVLSAILFCIYIDDLIKELRHKRDGCWINNRYVGIAVYADDIVLLSPALDGLQNMVDTCSQYAKKYHLVFSTNENPAKSKTKCMAFLRNERKLRNIKLNDKDLPWITSIKHLGSTIKNNFDCNMKQDISEKRAAYIAKNNELNQEFHYADPNTKIWLNNVFNSSFYGAPLWDLFDRDFEKLEKSWNVSQRIMLTLPRRTHRYFIEPLSCTSHISKSIKDRFTGFVEKIRKSKKEVLRCMLRTIEHDCRSRTGRNLRRRNIETTNGHGTKVDKVYADVSEEDQWRINIAKEIIGIKFRNLIVPSLSPEELDDIMEFVCCS